MSDPTSTPNAPQRPASLYVLNPSNAKSFHMQNDLIKKAFKNPHTVHKITIQNTQPFTTKLNIGKAVTKQARPLLIIPMDIKYKRNKAVEFYCRCCAPALHKFCENNLQLELTINDKLVKLPMRLTISVEDKNAQKLYPKDILKNLLQSHARITKTTVNLQSFEKIPGIGKNIYFDITFPNALNYILQSVKTPDLKFVNLSHNNLETIKGWRRLPAIDSLDLSFNQISTLDDFVLLLRTNVKHIILYENPFQRNFSSNSAYVQKIKDLFPNIETIDTNSVSTEVLETPEMNIIASEAAVYLVDQFMEHYYTLYDDPKRRKYLQEIYHPKAIFSLSSSIMNEANGLCQSSQRFKHHAHNLLLYNLSTDFIAGPAEIIRKICYLPQIEHDPTTFKVDILFYDENKSVMFTIYGIFRELGPEPVLYGFNRTFMLLAGQHGEFHIINDLLFVSNRPFDILPEEKKPFLSKYRYRNKVELKQKLPPATSKEQQDCFIAILIELTSLHMEPARNLLEQCNWDMKEALVEFIHNCRFGAVPFDYFIVEEIKQIICKELPVIKEGMDTAKLGKMIENMKMLQKDHFGLSHKNFDKDTWRKQLADVRKILLKDD